MRSLIDLFTFDMVDARLILVVLLVGIMIFSKLVVVGCQDSCRMKFVAQAASCVG